MERKSEEKDKKKEFNISVTYDKNGKSFQEIVENILLRKIRGNYGREIK